MARDKLVKYRSKRSESKTPEPFTSKISDPDNLHFVVQKHRATALHYDFRLEIGGVLVSWAIPKGPTLDTTVRRLAMQTEDHPLDYQNFEGEIPKGEYGGGSVIIWDRGIYFAEVEVDKSKRRQIKDKGDGDKVMHEGLRYGEIKFYLNGQRLKGSFALVKTKGFPPGKSKNAWLLIKHKDKHVKEGFDCKNFTSSVASELVLT